MTEQEKEMKTFLISYPYQGKRWDFDIPAEDFVDAEAKLSQMAFGKVDGELKFRIPVPTWWDLLKRLFRRAET